MANTYHFQNDLTRPPDPISVSPWSEICEFLAWEWESRLRLWDRMLIDGSYPPGNVMRFASPEERTKRLGALIAHATAQRDGFLARAAAHQPQVIPSGQPGATDAGVSPPTGGAAVAGVVPSDAGIFHALPIKESPHGG